jgi:hypothetical protein
MGSREKAGEPLVPSSCAALDLVTEFAELAGSSAIKSS